MMSEIVTSKQLADCLGLTERRINQLIEQDGFKPCKIGRGEINLCQFIRIYIAYTKEAEIISPLDPRKSRAEYQQALADGKKLDLAVRLNQLIYTQDALDVFIQLQDTLNQQLEMIPGRLSNVLASHLSHVTQINISASLIYDVVFKEIRRIRETLAKEIELLATNFENSSDCSQEGDPTT